MHNAYLCIHSHFYQPPRENPWLEEIEYQDSAKPFHDWNERISAECYRNNGLSRILDHEGWVTRLTNNYSRISFNFGPTLLSWMEDHDPIAYQAILEGDRKSIMRYDGHGSALAQAYNHMIMPLAHRRDKETQIIWGLRDFQSRFKRDPEAMWLPETAVDTETLEILADYGMKYVILAPRQAHSVRKAGEESAWRDVQGEQVNPRQPYKVHLPNGKEIAAFFYDGPVSRAVAFEGLLHDGEGFAHRLLDGLDHNYKDPQLMHIATDGESYGHHHPRGEMALSYALDFLERHGLAKIVNYGKYLAEHPPEYEAKILDDSSWSCVHGIERWRSDCGCNSGGAIGWHQKWRQPLRRSFDVLRDRLEKPYEDFMSSYTDEPWDMRDDYIDVILNRSHDRVQEFLNKWLKEVPKDKVVEQKILEALEMQRNLQLIYTSCAWFFDEISGIETVQNLQYAVRVIELARDVFNLDLEPEFLGILKSAPSNIERLGSGDDVYTQYALPAKVDFLRIGAHLASSFLFRENEGNEGTYYCYDYVIEHIERLLSGNSHLICSSVVLRSHLTREEQGIEFVIIHFGDHNINIGVRPAEGEQSFQRMWGEYEEVFGRGDLSAAMRLFGEYFEEHLYSLKDLFRDEQKAIMDEVLGQTLDSLEEQFLHVYDRYHPVMCYLSDIHLALPPVFLNIASFVQHSRIRKALQREEIDMSEIARYVNESKDWRGRLDRHMLGQYYEEALQRIFDAVQVDPFNMKALEAFAELVRLIPVFPFDIDTGNIQNIFYVWFRKLEIQMPDAPEGWKKLVSMIAESLKIRIAL